MIRMVSDGELFCPQIVCDWCVGPITDAQDAHVLWLIHEGKIKDGLILHTHKGACNRAIEAAVTEQGYSTAWTPLGAHLMQLACNVGIKTEAQLKAACDSALEMSGRVRE